MFFTNYNPDVGPGLDIPGIIVYVCVQTVQTVYVELDFKML
jgi:hypothetical protein